VTNRRSLDEDEALRLAEFVVTTTAVSSAESTTETLQP
jgi:hypothetical protein